MSSRDTLINVRLVCRLFHSLSSAYFPIELRDANELHELLCDHSRLGLPIDAIRLRGVIMISFANPTKSLRDNITDMKVDEVKILVEAEAKLDGLMHIVLECLIMCGDRDPYRSERLVEIAEYLVAIGVQADSYDLMYAITCNEYFNTIPLARAIVNSGVKFAPETVRYILGMSGLPNHEIWELMHDSGFDFTESGTLDALYSYVCESSSALWTIGCLHDLHGALYSYARKSSSARWTIGYLHDLYGARFKSAELNAQMFNGK